MDQSIDTRVRVLERRLRSWRLMAGAILVLTGLAWFGGFSGADRVEAQQARRQRDDPPARPRIEFGQAEVVYARMAELIGDWERKGWETYQVVPVFPASPAAGRPMTVAIVFRRPAK
jgi:hypothetical protein